MHTLYIESVTIDKIKFLVRHTTIKVHRNVSPFFYSWFIVNRLISLCVQNAFDKVSSNVFMVRVVVPTFGTVVPS